MKTYTKLHFMLVLSLLGNIAFAQNTKVVDSPTGTVISNAAGADIPYSASILDIRSTNKGVLFPRMSTANRDAIASPQAGLLVYNTSTNQFNYHNGSSWQAASFGNQWGVNGSILHHSGRVGIGTSTMTTTNTFLTVRGNLGGTNLEGMYMDASSKTGKAFYGYSLNDSSAAYHYYDGNNSKWNLSIGGADRLTVTSTGSVGIGITTPAYKFQVNGNSYLSGYTVINSDAQVNYNLNVDGSFDVDNDAFINGNANIDNNLVVDGTSTLTGGVTTGGNVTVGNSITVNNNATVDGTLTVNNGKGVLYNTHGSSQLKYYTREAEFTAILAGHGLSVEGTVGLAGGFTSPPAVMVGDIVSTGGTVGELFRVQLILYDCTTTSCKARLLNTSPNPVNYDVTWNLICIGN